MIGECATIILKEIPKQSFYDVCTMHEERGGSPGSERNARSPSLLSSYPGRAAGEFAGHPSGVLPDVVRDRDVPDRLQGIDSSLANSRCARKGGKEARRRYGDADRRLYVKWIRQRYAISRWIAFSVCPPDEAVSRVRSLSSRNKIVRGRPCSVRFRARSIAVALIASSKRGLIDEFRRRVARK